jgi:putative resolvase
MHFSGAHVEVTLAAQGRRRVAAHPDEMNEDLVPDMLEVLTSLCARLYGSARNRPQKGLAAAEAM